MLYVILGPAGPPGGAIDASLSNFSQLATPGKIHYCSGFVYFSSPFVGSDNI